jgi:hypothetical protein
MCRRAPRIVLAFLLSALAPALPNPAAVAAERPLVAGRNAGISAGHPLRAMQRARR